MPPEFFLDPLLPNPAIHIIRSRGTYTRGLFWAPQDEISTPPPNLKVSKAALMGFSHVHPMHGLSTLSLSQGRVLGATSESRGGIWGVYSQTGRESGVSHGRGPAGPSAGGHVLRMTSSSQWCSGRNLSEHLECQSPCVGLRGRLRRCGESRNGPGSQSPWSGPCPPPRAGTLSSGRWGGDLGFGSSKEGLSSHCLKSRCDSLQSGGHT